ncbi:gluconate 2-dehydrogenase subunit 3 family protein [Sphingobacterium detergens]|uniref:Gluconate 2-dehydrogenase subunit 3-like protein n=1 Tax=Sphingobacterium detergens TaxID=1145106 RepID=A0A420AY59_SPHD1|nr:gluconate 2-dehydrogenase subunit 3 family protein [Sphingobacterium detergens]RKE49377.1 gluconate 2-dehydrogenase subunit 3-like protein [Sphingobacterium detergens]
MNRRTAIKQFFIIAGGLTILSSCLNDGGASIVLNKLKLSAEDEQFLADLVDVLIPKTDTPGGKDLNLHLFVIKMVDDCESPENQEKFVSGFNKLRKQLNLANGKETENKLANLSDKTDEKTFFEIFKSRAIQGYMNSEYVMKNKVIYKLIPGPYNGAVKING